MKHWQVLKANAWLIVFAVTTLILSVAYSVAVVRLVWKLAAHR